METESKRQPAARSRRWRWARILGAMVAAGLVGMAGLVLVAGPVVHAAAENRLFEDPAEVPVRDVAIVPGALVFETGEPSIVVEDRLAGALALYQAHKVRKLLVSGDHGTPEYDEVNAMAAWLIRHGVPPNDVFLDHAGFRTLDTMMRAAGVFGVRSATVCTQRFHLPRAIFLARRSGIDALGLVVDRGPYPRANLDRRRERLAVPKAVLDSYVLHRGPRYGGPVIPIEGDGRVTQDRVGNELHEK